MKRDDWPSENLVVAALAELDSRMLILEDAFGMSLQIRVAAIRKLLANPPPMLSRPAKTATSNG